MYEAKMYAVIQSGSKQYRVKEGDLIDVELLGKEIGKAVEFKEVLFHNGEVGTPALNHFVVTGEVVEQTTGPKITFMKYRPSHNSRRKHGHRQKYSRVKITGIKKVK
jgi:large subunit ribosomal protein L21